MNNREKFLGKVEELSENGWGIINSPAGKIFIHYVLEGEEVEYLIKEREKGKLWGKVSKVLSPSRERVNVRCPYYDKCGGCNLLHIKYEHQLKYKKGILIKNLSNITNFPSDEIKIIYSNPYNYRLRAKLKGREDGKIGFIEKGKTSVLEIKNCFLFHEKINEFIKIWNCSEDMPFVHQIDLFFNPSDNKLYANLSLKPEKTEFEKFFKDTVFSYKGKEEKSLFSIKIGDYSYQISASLFFQSNLFLLENMLNTVEGFLKRGETAIDLYSGIGFFIPVLKKYYENIYAVESNKLSFNLLKKNFQFAKAYRMVSSKFSFPPADILLADPPRSGMDERTIKRILKKRYERIVYISCSQKGFKKDLKEFIKGGYKLSKITMIDLFPHTPYFETISLLEYQ